MLKIRDNKAHANTAITQPCPANGEWWKLVGCDILDPFFEFHAFVNALYWCNTQKNFQITFMPARKHFIFKKKKKYFILIRYSDSWKKKRNLLNKKPYWRESLPSRTVHEGSRDDEHDCASCKRSREAHQTVHRNVRMLPVVRTCYHRKYFARLYFRGNSLRVMLECVDKLLGGIWFSLSTQLRRLTWETKIFSHCKLGMKAHLSDVAHQGGWPNSKQSEDRSTKSASFRWW